MGLYNINGRVFDALVYLFTFGSEEKLKERAVQRLGLAPGNVVLDWGCGTGLSTRQIERYLKTGKIYAVDNAAPMMGRAVAQSVLRDDLKFHFILANGADVALPEKVDAALACYSLGVLPAERFEEGVRTIWQTMKDDGRLAVVETKITEPKTRMDHVHHWIRRVVLRNFFEDKCSDDLLPTIERYFEPIDIEDAPALNSVAFVGKRRSVPITARATMDAVPA